MPDGESCHLLRPPRHEALQPRTAGSCTGFHNHLSSVGGAEACKERVPNYNAPPLRRLAAFALCSFRNLPLQHSQRFALGRLLRCSCGTVDASGLCRDAASESGRDWAAAREVETRGPQHPRAAAREVEMRGSQHPRAAACVGRITRSVGEVTAVTCSSSPQASLTAGSPHALAPPPPACAPQRQSSPPPAPALRRVLRR